jgi:hypothetical protein
MILSQKFYRITGLVNHGIRFILKESEQKRGAGTMRLLFNLIGKLLILYGIFAISYHVYLILRDKVAALGATNIPPDWINPNYVTPVIGGTCLGVGIILSLSTKNFRRD